MVTLEVYERGKVFNLNINMKKTIIISLAIIMLALVAAFYLFRSGPANAELDSFAQCLADKNVTMYGAYWCGHCQNQKKAFGESFRFVPYVECTQDPNKCLAAGVDAYPTWIFPASPAGGPNGKKLVGELEIQELSQESGCLLAN